MAPSHHVRSLIKPPSPIYRRRPNTRRHFIKLAIDATGKPTAWWLGSDMYARPLATTTSRRGFRLDGVMRNKWRERESERSDRSGTTSSASVSSAEPVFRSVRLFCAEPQCARWSVSDAMNELGRGYYTKSDKKPSCRQDSRPYWLSVTFKVIRGQ